MDLHIVYFVFEHTDKHGNPCEWETQNKQCVDP
jgi:hypothetical protein